MIDQRLPAQFDTLGLHTPAPWALPALRLLFANPRTYPPLVDAWNRRHPGSRAALKRLHRLGFATRQPGIIFDTRTGLPAAAASRAVPRYVATRRGAALAAAAREDPAVLTDRYPLLRLRNTLPVATLLTEFDLRRAEHGIGRSVSAAATASTMPRSTIRWWVARWLREGLLKPLPYKIPDVREVIPPHWRPTTELASHLRRLLRAFPAWNHLAADFGIARFHPLPAISLPRITEAGTTDYDHDIGAQEVFAALLRSPTLDADQPWRAERAIRLPVDTGTRPWHFTPHGTGAVSYQPDAIYQEHHHGGGHTLAVYEYERSQLRRNAWGHIEHFLGYVHLHATTEAVLRFVVASRTREPTYTDLVDAYADYLQRHPNALPRVGVRIEVASRDRLLAEPDPLTANVWHRVTWPANPNGAPPRHPASRSPVDDYF